jgi:iron-siderophore transport system substrate-binding protein
VLRGELNTETIAALRPDLIVAMSAGLTPEQYGDVLPDRPDDQPA